MDYKTKPTSRSDLRRYANIMRRVFEFDSVGPFPVLEALDKLCEIFPGCTYEIVEDKILPAKTMAQCTPDNNGGFIVEIKESVYNGAYNGVGALRGFICHELCHVFLFKIGFTPLYECSFAENEIPAYCSVEWQAKALCSEVMIPYNESLGMKPREIVNKYKVSKAFANHRCKLDRPKKYNNR